MGAIEKKEAPSSGSTDVNEAHRPPPPSRHTVVDLIRLIACIIVIFCHIIDDSWPAMDGVRCFFFISGYVLWRKDDRNDTRDLIQRVLRLWPQSLLSIALGMAVLWYRDGWTWDYFADLNRLIYLRDNSSPVVANDVMWTIPYESVAPMVVALLRQARNEYKLLGGMVILCSVSYFWFLQIILGSLIKGHRLDANKYFVALCGTGTIVYLVFSFVAFSSLNWLWAQFLPSMLFILLNKIGEWLPPCEVVQVLCVRAITQSARLTFSLYLFHMPLYSLTEIWLPSATHGDAALRGAYFPLLIIFSALFTVLVDEPIARWSKRAVQRVDLSMTKYDVRAESSVAPDPCTPDPKQLSGIADTDISELAKEDDEDIPRVSMTKNPTCTIENRGDVNQNLSSDGNFREFSEQQLDNKTGGNSSVLPTAAVINDEAVEAGNKAEGEEVAVKETAMETIEKTLN